MAQEVVTSGTGPSMRPGSAASNSVRFINVVLGVWLFISAFVWKHSPQSFANTWIMGVIITAVALIALAVPQIRYVNTAAAVYLFLASIFMHHVYAATGWHNAILAIIVFIVSLVPSRVYGEGTTLGPFGRRRPAHV